MATKLAVRASEAAELLSSCVNHPPLRAGWRPRADWQRARHTLHDAQY